MLYAWQFILEENVAHVTCCMPGSLFGMAVYLAVYSVLYAWQFILEENVAHESVATELWHQRADKEFCQPFLAAYDCSKRYDIA